MSLSGRQTSSAMFASRIVAVAARWCDQIDYFSEGMLAFIQCLQVVCTATSVLATSPYIVGTQDCWFRLATTLPGICATDCWKLIKFHVSASHPYSALTIKNFAEILSKTLVYNGLQDHAVPAQRRGRTLSVPLAEPKRILQDERAHVPGNLGRSKKGRSKQARCLRCYRDEGVLH